MVWCASDCGKGIQILEVFASSGKVGIRVTYVNSKVRLGILTCENAKKPPPRMVSTPTQSDAKIEILRDFMEKSFSKPSGLGSNGIYQLNVIRYLPAGPAVSGLLK
jgi:hypothetical protein